MCGLAGVCGELTYKELDAFKTLLYVSSLRGMDSTGLAILTKKAWESKTLKASLIKSVGPANNLIDSRQYDKALTMTNKKILLGHTRAATVGDIRVSNAHPFEFSRFVGAHNGTLDYNTRRDLKDWNYFETDSEALIHNINETSIQDVIPTQEGAWALTIADKQEGTISFLRNSNRDLCFAFTESRQALFWASEPGFLKFVLTREGVKYEDEKIYRFPENVMFTFEIPKNSQKFAEETRTAIKGKERPVYTPANSARVFEGNIQRNARNIPFRRPPTLPGIVSNVVKLFEKHNITPSVDGEDDTSISLLPKFHEDFYFNENRKKSKIFYYKGWGNQKWSEVTFTNRVKSGCAFCSEIPVWGDNIVFCRHNAFLCQKCSGDEGIESFIETGDMSIIHQGGHDDLNDPLPTIN